MPFFQLYRKEHILLDFGRWSTYRNPESTAKVSTKLIRSQVMRFANLSVAKAFATMHLCGQYHNMFRNAKWENYRKYSHKEVKYETDIDVVWQALEVRQHDREMLGRFESTIYELLWNTKSEIGLSVNEISDVIKLHPNAVIPNLNSLQKRKLIQPKSIRKMCGDKRSMITYYAIDNVKWFLEAPLPLWYNNRA